MTEQTDNSPTIDLALLAKLTGGLGDYKTVEKICSEFGQLYAEFLPDVFQSETGFSIDVSYTGFQSGLMEDLLRELGPDFAFVNGSLRNWSPNFVLGCGNTFVIGLMERMLGAEASMVQQPPNRPLSDIELDLATMVFERIANVLRSGVNAPGGFEAMLERPYNGKDRVAPDEEGRPEFGAAIRMAIEIGKVTSEIALVIPQKALLKTKVVTPKSKGQAGKQKQEWAARIAEQVRRSQVTLEARIRLQSMTLNAVSRLMAGDVIAFEDKSDVRVQVSANGKDMYTCEFGRSGERYTVRVKDNVSSEDELLRHLMK
ncbi:FliM/FliN family flagellar motor switch protein [Rhizobium sp. SL86]|jgi:flagellar motor switch protein FliM|uniref:FliM/FliN family flagellar motor switch protein n=1 Tax=Rhizobium sp. SL86 TaxID=2995148 RepID=UPI002276378E|nr:FliM/FliN family flagellar motor switch protein [Rhizobium sp. SL86]MCY1664728.1 FliM/FliN family flagellar motor switch protein [Rhizobium sp. SL86]